jgi:hypothetical protein
MTDCGASCYMTSAMLFTSGHFDCHASARNGRTPLLYVSACASRPGSGGGSWTVASHTVAAVRIATSLATPAPTPVATAQLRASAQEERRSAGTGGVSLRAVFHIAARSRWVTRPANAPDPSVITFQPYLFNSATVSPYPGTSFSEHASK